MIAMRKLKRAGSLGLGDDRARNLHDGGGEHRDGSTPRKRQGADLVVRVGAGEGNRTLMTSLEGWGSAIELRPRHPAGCRRACRAS